MEFFLGEVEAFCHNLCAEEAEGGDVGDGGDEDFDLGPEGGDGGGTIVCTGTPEEVAACPGSYTGQYLARMLKPQD